MPLIYKIVAQAEWAEAEAQDRFEGAAVDLADGYIHFSDAGTVAETARRHFAGQDGLVLVAVEADRLGPALRWEASRGGALFPHLYGALQPSLAAWARPLPLGPDGAHAFPAEL